MSPEQLTTGQVVDRRSDVFAAGIILYEDARQPPAVRGGHAPRDHGASSRAASTRSPRSFSRRVPRKLAKLVAKAAGDQPEEAPFQTAGALANELRSAFLHSEGNPPESLDPGGLHPPALPGLQAARPGAHAQPLLRGGRELTPLLGTGRLAASEPDRPAPAAAVGEPTSAPPAEVAPALSSQAGQPAGRATPADAADSSAVVVADEAVAFGVLGLPDDYAVAKRAAEARRTEPELPRGEPPEEVFDDRPTDPKGARRLTKPGLPQLSPAAPAQAVGGRPVDPELLAAPTRILESGGGQASPRPATSAPVAGSSRSRTCPTAPTRKCCRRPR
ncbi:MAG: hypothetical protein MZW92_06185 [Comamonadaceae bacterium]|nr:hypothetical protein [Comamonadaceae bacterium]